ncbi:MarR family winged helix-turn-helix transcriptional regulator [Gemella sanguinis]|uniref:Transcriptional regulator SlyA n=1 Tax=Gemella sanguinis TaxID=84135 RepID=A0A2N6SCU9_9BACL|nr:MarR family transcriptional regulator [Gemella sanguinis]NKZ25309.1 MarR family transcriptional regulator [Gemella sanguinis]PMC51746.1 transcriptional regulator SlyA [Gemella sanguinis]
MLKDSLGHKLITILETMRNYTKAPLEKLGITHGHFITLLYISENEGLTQAQLAETHRKDRNIVSRNIDVLEEKGFVIRKRGITDRRSFTIHLTDLGHSVVSTHKDLIKEGEQEALRNLSKDEISIFYSLLNKIA